MQAANPKTVLLNDLAHDRAIGLNLGLQNWQLNNWWWLIKPPAVPFAHV